MVSYSVKILTKFCQFEIHETLSIILPTGINNFSLTSFPQHSRKSLLHAEHLPVYTVPQILRGRMSQVLPLLSTPWWPPLGSHALQNNNKWLFKDCWRPANHGGSTSGQTKLSSGFMVISCNFFLSSIPVRKSLFMHKFFTWSILVNSESLALFEKRLFEYIFTGTGTCWLTITFQNIYYSKYQMIV